MLYNFTFFLTLVFIPAFFFSHGFLRFWRYKPNSADRSGRYDWTHLVFSLWLTLEWWYFVSTFSLFVIKFLLTPTLTGGLRKDHMPWYRFSIVWNCVAELCLYFSISILTLRRPKQHRAQAPDVPYLAQTVKSWSELFKIFTNVFAGILNPKYISIFVKSCF